MSVHPRVARPRLGGGASRGARVAVGLVLLLLGAAVFVVAVDREDAQVAASTPPSPVLAPAEVAAQIERGAYLARAGNCRGCHTAAGGAEYAGGRGIDTPFGSVYAPNLTPDAATGLGRWTAADFWRALHHGRSKDGRLLYPAFPYTNYTHIERADADALWAYLRSLPAQARANTPHRLRFPVDRPAALAVWRALYFRAGPLAPAVERSARWQRGAYLVQGLGHCGACHAPRNRLGATVDEPALAGGEMAAQRWWAPSLQPAAAAGDAAVEAGEWAALLKTGVSARSAVIGPMAQVVHGSTQYLSDADIAAIVEYLGSLPRAAARAAAVASATDEAAALSLTGQKIYGDQCAGCHGAQGEGVAGIYPALAGNRSVQLDSAVNVVQAIVHGGYAPATAGNPRPYGMPPFGATLDDGEIAAVATYVRGAWGNAAPPVSRVDALGLR